MENYYVPVFQDTSTWDKTKKIVFLDEHFMVGLDEDFLASIDYIVVPDKDIPKIAETELMALKTDLVKMFTKELNDLHGVNFSEKYWDGMLYLYFWEFLYSVYDKYLRVQWILQNIGTEYGIYVDTIAEGICLISEDLSSYHEDILGGELHHIQMYSELFRLIDKRNNLFIREIDYKACEKNGGEDSKEYIRSRFIKKVIRSVHNDSLGEIWRKLKWTVGKFFFSSNNDFDRVEGIVEIGGWGSDAVLKSKGRIVERSFNIRIQGSDVDRTFRKLRPYERKAGIEMADFRKVAGYLVHIDIPKCYVEDYKRIRENIPKEYRSSKLKFIGTTTGFCYTKLVFAAMEARERGVKLFGIQHGGNYGLNSHVLGNYEIVHEDRFYAWGDWGREFADNIINAPVPKFVPYKKTIERGNGILFVGTILCRNKYVSMYSWNNTSRREYINRQIMMLKQLRQEVLDNVTVRQAPEEFGWNVNTILNSEFPKLKIEGAGKTYTKEFSRALCECELMIVDHLSTTWLEALYADKPFILVIDKNDVDFRESEKKYIDAMRKVGIIIESGNFGIVNEIYQDVSRWWKVPERQTVIKKLRDRYLTNQYCSAKELNEWWNRELQKWLDGNVGVSVKN